MIYWMPKILSSLTYIGPTFVTPLRPDFCFGYQKKRPNFPLEFSGAMGRRSNVLTRGIKESPSKTQWLFDADFMLLEGIFMVFSDHCLF